MAWFMSGSSRGMMDSHSFNCAASSITKTSRGSMATVCSLKELEAVENINDDACKQNSLIDSSVTASGRSRPPSETLRVLNRERHSVLLWCNEYSAALTTTDSKELS
ncbi:hypothetical protein P8452_38883 [Trifolium repens]|nr:hypothetical protein P8452_38883 [Trifolium repens]